MTRTKLKSELNTTLILNILGSLLFTLIIFVCGFMVAAIFSTNHAFLYSIVWTFGMIGIGILVKWRGMYDEWRTMSLSWDINSAGSYVAHRELLKVTGTAYVASEIIMSSSSCILKTMDVLYKKWQLKRITDDDIAQTIAPFEAAAKGGKRFIPLNGIDLSHKALKILVLTGVLWYKKDGEVILLGLNRKYDGLTNR